MSSQNEERGQPPTCSACGKPMVLEVFPKGFGGVIVVDTPVWYCPDDRYVSAYGNTVQRLKALSSKKIALTCMSILFVVMGIGLLLYLDLVYDRPIDLLVVVGAIAIGITITKTTALWEVWKTMGGTGLLGRRNHKHRCPVCRSRWRDDEPNCSGQFRFECDDCWGKRCSGEWIVDTAESKARPGDIHIGDDGIPRFATSNGVDDGIPRFRTRHGTWIKRIGATSKERLHGNDGGSGPGLARQRFWGLSYYGWMWVAIAFVVATIVVL